VLVPLPVCELVGLLVVGRGVTVPVERLGALVVGAGLLRTGVVGRVTAGLVTGVLLDVLVGVRTVFAAAAGFFARAVFLTTLALAGVRAGFLL
jgi:hypothetical protein